MELEHRCAHHSFLFYYLTCMLNRFLFGTKSLACNCYLQEMLYCGVLFVQMVSKLLMLHISHDVCISYDTPGWDVADPILYSHD